MLLRFFDVLWNLLLGELVFLRELRFFRLRRFPVSRRFLALRCPIRVPVVSLDVNAIDIGEPVNRLTVGHTLSFGVDADDIRAVEAPSDLLPRTEAGELVRAWACFCNACTVWSVSRTAARADISMLCCFFQVDIWVGPHEINGLFLVPAVVFFFFLVVPVQAKAPSRS